MRRLMLVAGILLLAIVSCTDGAQDVADGSVGVVELGTPAPEFPDSAQWLNTTNPVELGDVGGKVTLVHFWRSSCLSCLEALAEMAALQVEFGDDLVIIGVHSPKFPRETTPGVVGAAAREYQYTGLVVVDNDLEIWDDWGIRVWPTAAVLDHQGDLVGGHVGLGADEALRPLIASLVAEAPDNRDGAVDIVSSSLPPATPSILSSPEGVLADPVGNRLFIADTGHHRIVVAALDTHEVVSVIGEGTSGSSDGAAASFSRPRGMTLDATGSTLYVADTGNHLIRSVDLDSLEVTTVAGTGQRGGPLAGEGPSRETALNAPWDVGLHPDGLAVTLAGANQLVLIDLEADTVRVVAGTGRMGTETGGPESAEFATPSGLATGPAGSIYLADSESSTVKKVATNGSVEDVAGGTDGLFEFGDEDGLGAAVRLQRPQGIALAGDTLWVADTYNSKIKQIDSTTGQVKTLIGGEGWRDGPTPLFSAPADIDLANGVLYVADRDNHSVRIVDLATGATSTVILEGIERLVPDDAVFDGTLVALDPVKVGIGGGTVILDVTFPPGYKANESARSRFQWLAHGDVVAMPATADTSLPGPEFPMEFEFSFLPGEGRLQGDIWLVYCESVAESICLFDRARLDIPLLVQEDGPATVAVAYEVTLPDGL